MSQEDKIVASLNKSGDADAPRPLFSSVRERRLWVWTLSVVAAIYSTLGLATTLAGALRDRGLLAAAFVLGMFLVGAAIVALALKARPGGAEIGVVLGVAAAYLLVFLRMAIPVERSHLIEYGAVAAFIYETLRASEPGLRRPRTRSARRRSDGASRSDRRMYPSVSAQPRVRPSRHSVQRSGRRDSGCRERDAGLGTTAGRVSREMGGAGLGLSISQAFVNAYGGTITAVSERVRMGTAVRFTLPSVTNLR
jgi:hypothetical protein